MKPKSPHAAALALTLALLPACARHDPADQHTLRIGYFPNITHAQALIGATLTAEKKSDGWFEQRLGNGTTLQWFPYNAGPAAMEALIAGTIDLTYVGPNPALNVYFRSRGAEIRLIAGSATGGAALLVRPDAHITTPADFRGKTLATPQFGNTQDIAARVWLKTQGHHITQSGGDVTVLPTANPDQLALFRQGKIDAAWTVEPWVTRIEREAAGRVYLEQPDAITTILVASVAALKNKPALVQQFHEAHRALTTWLNDNPAEAQRLVQRAIAEATTSAIPLDQIQAAWPRLHFTAEIQRPPLRELVAQSRALGFIRDQATPLSHLFETNLDK